MSELREEIAAVVSERMFAADLRAKEHFVIADRILALPQIAEALTVYQLARGGAGPFPTLIGK